MRILVFLFLSVSLLAQEETPKEIDIVKQQVGPDINLVATNYTADPYVIHFDVQSVGMKLSRSVPADVEIGPNATVTLITLTPIPGKRWSYRQSYSYELAPMAPVEEASDMPVEFDDEPSPVVKESRENNPADDMESVRYRPKEYRTDQQTEVEQSGSQDENTRPPVQESRPPVATRPTPPEINTRPSGTASQSETTADRTGVWRSEYIPGAVSDQFNHPSPKVDHQEADIPVKSAELAFLSNQYIPGSVKREAMRGGITSRPSEVKGDIREDTEEEPVVQKNTAMTKDVPRVLGLRTAAYFVPDITAAKAWYSKAFGVEPYFDEPFYVGFNIGGFELGIMPAEKKDVPAQLQNVTYWGVDNIQKSYAHFLAVGATSVEAPNDVGSGIMVTSLQDPWGNVIGLIYNPHFQPE